MSMRAAISYFYQIRFFKPYMIPLSTAIWDPKWFHKGLGPTHVFRDKNGVINGLRINPLVPTFEGNTTLCHGRDDCIHGDPETCAFRKRYAEQLRRYPMDEFKSNLERSMREVADTQRLRYEDMLAVFIVYETPDNKCSEREELIKWFADNGEDVKELVYPISDNY